VTSSCSSSLGLVERSTMMLLTRLCGSFGIAKDGIEQQVVQYV
jgi:hypothetical protein